MTNNSLALHYAHRLLGRTWRECVTKGWELVRLKELMKQKVVRFSYYKDDDTLRIAYGTLRTDLIPEEKHPKGNGKINLCFSRFNYFDIGRNGWRSFKINNLLKRGFHVCKPLWVVDYETNLQKCKKKPNKKKGPKKN